MMLRRGMLPFRPEAVPLKLNKYLDAGLTWTVPHTFGHVIAQNPPTTGGWGMYGNDNVGDCVCAGGEHEHMIWCWATRKPIPTFKNTSLSNYSAMLVAQGGRPYDANDPSTDTGLDPVQAAQWRQTVGLTDDAGVVHKVGPFVSIGSLRELELTGYLFGAAGLCWNLPDSAEDQFGQGHIWDDTSGDPAEGHYTVYAGRNSAGVNFCVTWGGLQGFTEAYASKYMAGSIGYLDREYILATGKSPEGIDWSTLAADQQAIVT